MKRYAIILAGGHGLRMGTSLPKQFLKIAGKPIIVHAIEKFLAYDKSITFIVVLPPNQLDSWEIIQRTYFPYQDLVLALGGKNRAQSVRAGLVKIGSSGIVAIHDAARPFVSKDTIAESFASAENHGSGIAAVELKDSLRKVVGKKSYSRDRINYKLIQTPQTFRIPEIKQAYIQIESNEFTDDASLYEAAGFEIELVPGSYGNIKITTPEDLTHFDL